jgi:translation initiation factor IF-1
LYNKEKIHNGGEMMKEANSIELTGKVLEVLPGAKFLVELDGNGNKIYGHLSGKMRMNHIKILIGDRIKVEMSPYDLTKGRITYRFK